MYLRKEMVIILQYIHFDLMKTAISSGFASDTISPPINFVECQGKYSYVVCLNVYFECIKCVCVKATCTFMSLISSKFKILLRKSSAWNASLK